MESASKDVSFRRGHCAFCGPRHHFSLLCHVISRKKAWREPTQDEMRNNANHIDKVANRKLTYALRGQVQDDEPSDDD